MNTLRSHTGRARRAIFAVTLLVASVACGASSPTAPSDSCSFTLSAPSQAFAADGGTGTVSVTTGPTCAWSVQGAEGWLTLTSPPAMNGPGTISYLVAVNASEAGRDKTLTIATVPFTVRQDGRSACRFSIDPERHRVGSRGDTVAVTVAPTVPT